MLLSSKTTSTSRNKSVSRKRRRRSHNNSVKGIIEKAEAESLPRPLSTHAHYTPRPHEHTQAHAYGRMRTYMCSRLACPSPSLPPLSFISLSLSLSLSLFTFPWRPLLTDIIMLALNAFLGYWITFPRDGCRGLEACQCCSCQAQDVLQVLDFDR